MANGKDGKGRRGKRGGGGGGHSATGKQSHKQGMVRCGRDKGSRRGGRKEVAPDLAVAGPSTRTGEEKYARIKKNVVTAEKVTQSLDPSIRKKLIARKCIKQLSRSFLPDAPPRKRSSKNSPERVNCRLVPGTPCKPPALKLQPWQMSKDESRERLECTLDPGTQNTTPLAEPLSIQMSISEVSVFSELLELEVDRTTGELKNPSASVLVAPQAAASPSLSSPVPSTSFSTEAYDITPTLQTFLDEMGEIDDELDVDVDVEETEMTNEQIHRGYLALADFTDDLNDELRKWLQNDDKESDRLFKRLLPTDQFTFDWSCDHNTFKGQREIFRGNSGPTFPVTDKTKPLDIFFKICDDDFFELLVTNTNKYAAGQINEHLSAYSRLICYKDVDKNEMGIFLAMLILQGLVALPVEKDYWYENGYLTLKYFKNLMSYDRFVLLKRLLYFIDSDITRLNLTKEEKKLWKIQPVLDMFNKKFRSLYYPGQNICIDESLLKWKGRLSFVQTISTKAAKTGIKSYELCESNTGYLWNFLVYAGKTDRQSDELENGPTDRQFDEPTDGPTAGMTLPNGATSKVVNYLVAPLLNRGHTLIMDNFYNSPLLARYLKSKGTDCYGTLRVNREFVPKALKSLQKSELRPGELVQSFTHDLSVCSWRDASQVSLISTYHTGLVGGKEKYGIYKYKPQVVLDYNLSMGGVDKKDQLLSGFRMERIRNQSWYKKVFRRLLNCAVLNCYIIYKSHTPHATHRWFRNQLSEELIKFFKPLQVERNLNVLPVSFANVGKRTFRPILIGNHFIGTGTSKYLTCVWCHKSRTKYICKQCDVSLCLQICFEEYHTVRYQT